MLGVKSESAKGPTEKYKMEAMQATLRVANPLNPCTKSERYLTFEPKGLKLTLGKNLTWMRLNLQRSHMQVQSRIVIFTTKFNQKLEPASALPILPSGDMVS